ncbi:MAG: peroxiredoxin-like family protein [Acidimicrobiia bacterium]
MPETPDLQSRIDDTMNGMTPANVQEMIDRMVDDLRARRVTPGIEIGEAAPMFSAPNATGEVVTLEDRLAGGPVVLSFYRGAWCPICNIELRALQESLPEIRALGASLIAVNPQSPDDSLSFAEKLELDFDVLSDVDQTIAAAYRVRFTLSDELQSLYDQFGMSLTAMNADGSWDLPVPATFVIDAHGIVRARHVDPDYRKRMEPSAILAALRELAAP